MKHLGEGGRDNMLNPLGILAKDDNERYELYLFFYSSFFNLPSKFHKSN